MTIEYKLNPFFRITLEKPLKIEMPLEAKVFECEDYQLVQAITLLNESFSSEFAVEIFQGKLKLSKNESEDIFRELKNIGLIVDTKYHLSGYESAKHWEKRGWGDAFYLHCFSRDIDYTDDVAHKEGGGSREIRKDVCQSIVASDLKIWEIPSGIEVVKLPEPIKLPKDRNLDDILKARRSNMPWNVERPFKIYEISQILYYANLESKQAREKTENQLLENPENALNFSSFSALETKIIVLKDIESIKAGIYHYDIKNHSLIKLKNGLFEDDLIKMCIGQRQLKGAAFSFIITAYWEKYFKRYSHARAYRNLLVNAGELAQKYLLLATIYEMSQFITPAFEDKFADELLGCNGYETAPIYSITLG